MTGVNVSNFAECLCMCDVKEHPESDNEKSSSIFIKQFVPSAYFNM